jgi:hypothetical protein
VILENNCDSKNWRQEVDIRPEIAEVVEDAGGKDLSSFDSQEIKSNDE